MEYSRDAIVQVFVAEAQDQLGHMEDALLALEAGTGDPELLAGLFRCVHTLKGNALSLGFAALAELSHAVEDLLERLRQGGLAVTADLVTLMLQAVDALRAGVAASAAGREAALPHDGGLRERIASWSAGCEAVDAPASMPAAPEQANAPQATSAPHLRTLRVAVEKLDRMMDLAGEIAVARGQVQALIDASTPGIRDAYRQVSRLFLEMQELILRIRMVPLGPRLRPHARNVRDLAASLGKLARLVIEGEDLELDTAVVERLRDPLLHLIHNALDHGIEPPAVREAAGKDPCGTIRLRAFRETGRVRIEVADDGAGLQRARIAARARSRGLASGTDPLADDHLEELIFAPGFSTAEQVTDVSGRGVGLDVVRRDVTALRGTVAVESREGAGTTFTIRLPLTLAIIDGFGVTVGGDTFVVPLDSVVECLALTGADRLSAEGRGVVDIRGEALPCVRLRRCLGVSGVPDREGLVVVRQGGGRMGLVVDGLLGEQQTVIKPLGALLQRAPGIAGSAVLGNGRVALILDVPALLHAALAGRAAAEQSYRAGGGSPARFSGAARP